MNIFDMQVSLENIQVDDEVTAWGRLFNQHEPQLLP